MDDELRVEGMGETPRASLLREALWDSTELIEVSGSVLLPVSRRAEHHVLVLAGGGTAVLDEEQVELEPGVTLAWARNLHIQVTASPEGLRLLHQETAFPVLDPTPVQAVGDLPEAPVPEPVSQPPAPPAPEPPPPPDSLAVSPKRDVRPRHPARRFPTPSGPLAWHMPAARDGEPEKRLEPARSETGSVDAWNFPTASREPDDRP